MKLLLAVTLITGMVLGVKSTVEKTGRLVDQSKVSFNLSDDKKLNGPFEIKDVKGVSRVRGSYTENRRSGNWYCFDTNGKTVLRYNYDLNKLIVLDESQYAGVDIVVVDKDPEVVKNASIPVPVCSVTQLTKLVEEQLKNDMPQRLKEEGGTVDAKFSIKISPEGKAKYSAEYVFKGLSYKTMVFMPNKVFEIDWLPASYQGKSYASEISFSSSFEALPADHKRFIWNQ